MEDKYLPLKAACYGILFGAGVTTCFKHFNWYLVVGCVVNGLGVLACSIPDKE